MSGDTLTAAVAVLHEWRAESDPDEAMPLARRLSTLSTEQRALLLREVSRPGLIQALCDLSLEVISDDGELAITLSEMAATAAADFSGAPFVW